MRHLPAVYRFKRYGRYKARLKCATYRRYTDLSVMGVRVGRKFFFGPIDRYRRDQHISVKIFYLAWFFFGPIDRY